MSNTIESAMNNYHRQEMTKYHHQEVHKNVAYEFAGDDDGVPSSTRKRRSKSGSQRTASRDTTSCTTGPSLELILEGRNRVPETRIWIKVSDLDRREAEMQEAAKQFQIPSDRWAGSLLYRQYYEMGMEQLRLDPEHDCIERNYSYAMQWEDWLTVLLAQYYETGRLNIPDSCQGSDLLLLLEYFGILYAPDQLVFASYSAYQRVRAWSDYLTQRSILADHVVNLITLVPARSVRVFQLGTVEAPSEKLKLLPINNRSAETPPVYSWGCDVTDLLSQSHLAPQSLPNSRVIYNLFNMTKENKVAEALRDDFGVYLQNMLPSNSDVTFSVKMVQVHSSSMSEPFRGKRAILKITVEPIRTKSELTHPVDEVAMNRLSPETAELPSLGKKNHHFSQEDKRTTIDADHVYRDLDGVVTPPPGQDTNTGHKVPSKFNKQRSIDPVMAGNTEKWNAPVDVVDPFDSGTVTSALTGPFNGGDTQLGDEDVRAEALRQEWVQGSLLNRDIDDRMKELLEADKEYERRRSRQPSPIAEGDETHESKKTNEPGTPATVPSEGSNRSSPGSPDVDRGCSPWEWINLMCNGFLDPKSPSPKRKEPSRGGSETMTEKESESDEECPIPEPPKVAREDVQATDQPETATARGAQVVVNSLDPEMPSPTEKAQDHTPPQPKVLTHEGVKQRIAELRQKHEQAKAAKTARMHNVQQKSKSTTASQQSSKASKTSSKDTNSTVKRSTSPSKRAGGFFRGNKKQIKVITRKTLVASAPPSPKNSASASSAPKKSGLMKMFRRGNE